MIKKLISILLTFALIWTSGNAAEAAAFAPQVFVESSDLPQFRLNPPAKLGKIVDYYNAPARPLVILIQDLHANYGVQKNIAAILELLSDRLQKNPPLVPPLQKGGAGGFPPFALAVEGASGPIDSSVMALFPDAKIKEAASQYLMREGELTGAEYFAIKRGLPDLLVGVENDEYYNVHRDLFRKTLENREQLVQALTKIQTDIATLPRHVYSRELKSFQSKIDAFDKGEITSEEYVGYLTQRANATSLDLKDFPALAAFASNANALSPDALRSLTAQFLTTAASYFSLQERKNLSVLAKAPDNTPYDLYLRELIYQHQLFLAAPPELARHLEYVHTVETLGLDQVVHQANELAFRIKSRIASTQQEKDLVQVQHDLGLLIRLADLQATGFEVRDFAPRLNQFVALTKALFGQRVSEQASKQVSDDFSESSFTHSPTYPLAHSQPFDDVAIRRLISSSIDYYVMAMMRNQPMVDNTLALLRQRVSDEASKQVSDGSGSGNTHSLARSLAHSPDVAVLVTGGFHTAPLTQLLRERNVSYVVICPEVESLTDADEKLYVKRLSGQLLTDEEIFDAARKEAGPPDLPRTWLARLMGQREDKTLAVGLFGLAIAPHFLHFAGASWLIAHHWDLAALGAILTAAYLSASPKAKTILHAGLLVLAAAAASGQEKGSHPSEQMGSSPGTELPAPAVSQPTTHVAPKGVTPTATLLGIHNRLQALYVNALTLFDYDQVAVPAPLDHLKELNGRLIKLVLSAQENPDSNVLKQATALLPELAAARKSVLDLLGPYLVLKDAKPDSSGTINAYAAHHAPLPPRGEDNLIAVLRNNAIRDINVEIKNTESLAPAVTPTPPSTTQGQTMAPKLFAWAIPFLLLLTGLLGTANRSNAQNVQFGAPTGTEQPAPAVSQATTHVAPKGVTPAVNEMDWQQFKGQSPTPETLQKLRGMILQFVHEEAGSDLGLFSVDFHRTEPSYDEKGQRHISPMFSGTGLDSTTKGPQTSINVNLAYWFSPTYPDVWDQDQMEFSLEHELAHLKLEKLNPGVQGRIVSRVQEETGDHNAETQNLLAMALWAQAEADCDNSANSVFRSRHNHDVGTLEKSITYYQDTYSEAVGAMPAPVRESFQKILPNKPAVNDSARLPAALPRAPLTLGSTYFWGYVHYFFHHNEWKRDRERLRELGEPLTRHRAIELYFAPVYERERIATAVTPQQQMALVAEHHNTSMQQIRERFAGLHGIQQALQEAGQEGVGAALRHLENWTTTGLAAGLADAVVNLVLGQTKTSVETAFAQGLEEGLASLNEAMHFLYNLAHPFAVLTADNPTQPSTAMTMPEAIQQFKDWLATYPDDRRVQIEAIVKTLADLQTIHMSHVFSARRGAVEPLTDDDIQVYLAMVQDDRLADSAIVTIEQNLQLFMTNLDIYQPSQHPQPSDIENPRVLAAIEMLADLTRYMLETMKDVTRRDALIYELLDTQGDLGRFTMNIAPLLRATKPISPAKPGATDRPVPFGPDSDRKKFSNEDPELGHPFLNQGEASQRPSQQGVDVTFIGANPAEKAFLQAVFLNGGNEAIRKLLAPESKSFRVLRVSAREDGRMKWIFRAEAQTDTGMKVFGIRLYKTEQSPAATARDVAERNRDAINEVKNFHLLDRLQRRKRVAIRIDRFVSQNEDGDFHQIPAKAYTENQVMGFSIGEFNDGYALNRERDPDLVMQSLRKTLDTLVESWLLTMEMNGHKQWRGFVIKDLKRNNFIRDLGTDDVWYLDLDHIYPQNPTFPAFLTYVYEYVVAVLADEDKSADPVFHKRIMEVNSDKDLLSGVFTGLTRGILDHLEKSLGPNDQAKRDIILDVIRNTIANLSNGSSKEHNVKGAEAVKRQVLIGALQNVLDGLPPSSQPAAGNVDFGGASDNSVGFTREEHEAYHKIGNFAQVLRAIGTALHAARRPDGRFDLRRALRDQGKGPRHRMVLNGGQLQIEEDGLLAAIDPRLNKDHYGRNEYAAYARNKTMAVHEITELRLWARFAMNTRAGHRPIATAEDILSGRLGNRLREWLNDPSVGSTELLRRKIVMKSRLNEFHEQAVRAETDPSQRVAPLPQLVYAFQKIGWRGDQASLDYPLDSIDFTGSSEDPGAGNPSSTLARLKSQNPQEYQRYLQGAGTVISYIKLRLTKAWDKANLRTYAAFLENPLFARPIKKDLRRQYDELLNRPVEFSLKALQGQQGLPDNLDASILNDCIAELLGKPLVFQGPADALDPKWDKALSVLLDQIQHRQTDTLSRIAVPLAEGLRPGEPGRPGGNVKRKPFDETSDPGGMAPWGAESQAPKPDARKNPVKFEILHTLAADFANDPQVKKAMADVSQAGAAEENLQSLDRSVQALIAQVTTWINTFRASGQNRAESLLLADTLGNYFNNSLGVIYGYAKSFPEDRKILRESAEETIADLQQWLAILEDLPVLQYDEYGFIALRTLAAAKFAPESGQPGPASIHYWREMARTRDMAQAIKAGREGLPQETIRLFVASLASFVGASLVPGIGALATPILLLTGLIGFWVLHKIYMEEYRARTGRAPPAAESWVQAIQLSLYSVPGLAMALSRLAPHQVSPELFVPLATIFLGAAPFIQVGFDLLFFRLQEAKLNSANDGKVRVYFRPDSGERGFLSMPQWLYRLGLWLRQIFTAEKIDPASPADGALPIDIFRQKQIFNLLNQEAMGLAHRNPGRPFVIPAELSDPNFWLGPFKGNAREAAFAAHAWAEAVKESQQLPAPAQAEAIAYKLRVNSLIVLRGNRDAHREPEPNPAVEGTPAYEKLRQVVRDALAGQNRMIQLAAIDALVKDGNDRDIPILEDFRSPDPFVLGAAQRAIKLLRSKSPANTEFIGGTSHTEGGAIAVDWVPALFGRISRWFAPRPVEMAPVPAMTGDSRIPAETDMLWSGHLFWLGDPTGGYWYMLKQLRDDNRWAVFVFHHYGSEAGWEDSTMDFSEAEIREAVAQMTPDREPMPSEIPETITRQAYSDIYGALRGGDPEVIDFAANHYQKVLGNDGYGVILQIALKQMKRIAGSASQPNGGKKSITRRRFFNAYGFSNLMLMIVGAVLWKLPDLFLEDQYRKYLESLADFLSEFEAMPFGAYEGNPAVMAALANNLAHPEFFQDLELRRRVEELNTLLLHKGLGLITEQDFNLIQQNVSQIRLRLDDILGLRAPRQPSLKPSESGLAMAQSPDSPADLALTHPDTFTAAKIRIRLGRLQFLRWFFSSNHIALERTDRFRQALEHPLDPAELQWTYQKFAPWYLPEFWNIATRPIGFAREHKNYDPEDDTFVAQTPEQRDIRENGAVMMRAAIKAIAVMFGAFDALMIILYVTLKSITPLQVTEIALAGVFTAVLSAYLAHGLLHTAYHRDEQRLVDKAYLTASPAVGGQDPLENKVIRRWNSKSGNLEVVPLRQVLHEMADREFPVPGAKPLREFAAEFGTPKRSLDSLASQFSQPWIADIRYVKQLLQRWQNSPQKLAKDMDDAFALEANYRDTDMAPSDPDELLLLQKWQLVLGEIVARYRVDKFHLPAEPTRGPEAGFIAKDLLHGPWLTRLGLWLHDKTFGTAPIAQAQAGDRSMENWQAIRPARIPSDEIEQAKIFHRLTGYSTWQDVPGNDWAVLKAFVNQALSAQRENDLGMIVVDDRIIGEALKSPDGIRDLVRRIHPYTLHALAQRGQFHLHDQMHENVYYALYARKLLRTLPAGGIPVINFDPHSDAEYRTGEEQTNWNQETRFLAANDIKDSNWIAAAVKDGLAPYVVGVYLIKGEKSTFRLYSYEDGQVKATAKLPLAALNADGLLADSIVTVDLDAFSLGKVQKDDPSYHLDPREVPAYIQEYILKPLQQWHQHPLQIITATSPSYLHPKAKPIARYQARVVDALRSLFDNEYQRSATAPAQAIASEGDISRGFSKEEKEQILDRALPTYRNEENIQALSEFGALLGIEFQSYQKDPLRMAMMIKKNLEARPELNVPFMVNGVATHQTLADILIAAVKLISTTDIRSFDAVGTPMAIQSEETYILGNGRKKALSLIEAFFDGSLSNHRTQAILHEAMEAVTPAGADEAEAYAIHRALIDQIQSLFFDTAALKEAARQYIDRHAAEDNSRSIHLNSEVIEAANTTNADHMAAFIHEHQNSLTPDEKLYLNTAYQGALRLDLDEARAKAQGVSFKRMRISLEEHVSREVLVLTSPAAEKYKEETGFTLFYSPEILLANDADAVTALFPSFKGLGISRDWLFESEPGISDLHEMDHIELVQHPESAFSGVLQATDQRPISHHTKNGRVGYDTTMGISELYTHARQVGRLAEKASRSASPVRSLSELLRVAQTGRTLSHQMLDVARRGLDSMRTHPSDFSWEPAVQTVRLNHSDVQVATIECKLRVGGTLIEIPLVGLGSAPADADVRKAFNERLSSLAALSENLAAQFEDVQNLMEDSSNVDAVFSKAQEIDRTVRDFHEASIVNRSDTGAMGNATNVQGELLKIFDRTIAAGNAADEADLFGKADTTPDEAARAVLADLTHTDADLVSGTLMQFMLGALNEPEGMSRSILKLLLANLPAEQASHLTENLRKPNGPLQTLAPDSRRELLTRMIPGLLLLGISSPQGAHAMAGFILAMGPDMPQRFIQSILDKMKEDNTGFLQEELLRALETGSIEPDYLSPVLFTLNSGWSYRSPNAADQQLRYLRLVEKYFKANEKPGDTAKVRQDLLIQALASNAALGTPEEVVLRFNLIVKYVLPPITHSISAESFKTEPDKALYENQLDALDGWISFIGRMVTSSLKSHNPSLRQAGESLLYSLVRTTPAISQGDPSKDVLGTAVAAQFSRLMRNENGSFSGTAIEYIFSPEDHPHNQRELKGLLNGDYLVALRILLRHPSDFVKATLRHPWLAMRYGRQHVIEYAVSAWLGDQSHPRLMARILVNHYGDDPSMLQNIIQDARIDTEYRLLALAHWGDTVAYQLNPEVLLTSMQELAAPAKTMLEEFRDDAGHAERMLKSRWFADQEVTAYAMAMWIVMQNQLDMPAPQERYYKTMVRSLARTHVLWFYSNASVVCDSNAAPDADRHIVGGNAVLRSSKPEETYLQLEAHEIMHLILTHGAGYSPRSEPPLTSGALHERLADTATEAVSELLNLDIGNFYKLVVPGIWRPEMDHEVHAMARRVSERQRAQEALTGQRQNAVVYLREGIEVAMEQPKAWEAQRNFGDVIQAINDRYSEAMAHLGHVETTVRKQDDAGGALGGSQLRDGVITALGLLGSYGLLKAALGPVAMLRLAHGLTSAGWAAFFAAAVIVTAIILFKPQIIRLLKAIHALLNARADRQKLVDEVGHAARVMQNTPANPQAALDTYRSELPDRITNNPAAKVTIKDFIFRLQA